MNCFCTIPLVLVCFVSIFICSKIFFDFFLDPLAIQECAVYILFIRDEPLSEKKPKKKKAANLCKRNTGRIKTEARDWLLVEGWFEKSVGRD